MAESNTGYGVRKWGLGRSLLVRLGLLIAGLRGRVAIVSALERQLVEAAIAYVNTTDAHAAIGQKPCVIRYEADEAWSRHCAASWDMERIARDLRAARRLACEALAKIEEAKDAG